MDIKLTKDGKAYSLMYDNDEVRMRSTSGAAFTAISDIILNRQGAIIGASYDKEMQIVHKIAYTSEERDAMRGSKYVQSDIQDVIVKMVSLLKKERDILFIGTPCQIAAVKYYLEEQNISTKKIILCDFVCHGVPSPEINEEYFQILQKNGVLINYFYRDKMDGWHSHRERPVYKGEKQAYDIWLTRANIRLFNSGYTLRPSCYNCPYCNTNRISDITIGDCWGIEKVDPLLDDNKGLSLILVNTDKGRNIIENISLNIRIKEHNLIELLQPRLKESASIPAKRESFWKYYKRRGFEKALRKYAYYGIKGKIWYYITAILRILGITPYIKKVVKRRDG